MMTAIPGGRARPRPGSRAVRRDDMAAAKPGEPGLSKKPAPGVNTGADSSAGLSEEALVENARADREAFALLYDEHFDAVYNYIARRLGGDEALAEDISSEVWEKALIAIERYQTRGLPFRAWLFRIAGNLIANHHRRQRIRRSVALQPGHGMSRPQSGWDTRAAVQAALVQLSEGDQAVIGLYYFAGMKPPEIGLVLGCSQAAVHKRLHRARERLRSLL
jgi:RNA polymerase sigma-70 factor (ECF subfamily)